MQSNAYNSKQQKRRYDDEGWDDVTDKQAKKKKQKQDYSNQRKNKRGELDYV